MGGEESGRYHVERVQRQRDARREPRAQEREQGAACTYVYTGVGGGVGGVGVARVGEHMQRDIAALLLRYRVQRPSLPRAAAVAVRGGKRGRDVRRVGGRGRLGRGAAEPRADERERHRGGEFRLSGDEYRLVLTLAATRTRMGLGRPLELLAPRAQPAHAPLHPPYVLLERRERVLDVRVQRVLPVGRGQLRHRELEARDLRAEGGELRLRQLRVGVLVAGRRRTRRVRVDLRVERARARDDARDEPRQRAEGGREAEEGGRGRRGEGGQGAQEGDAEEGRDEADKEETEVEGAEGRLGAGGATRAEGGDVGVVGVTVRVRRRGGWAAGTGGVVEGPGDCGASAYKIGINKDKQEEQEEVLDVVAACKPVADGRRQCKEYGDGGLVPWVRGGRVVVVLFAIFILLVLLLLPPILLVACGCLGPAPRLLVIILASNDVSGDCALSPSPALPSSNSSSSVLDSAVVNERRALEVHPAAERVRRGWRRRAAGEDALV
ncbi:hypothetical protein B0H14DRAFT_3147682 [Mycena olivaceomarginata]|nr:hypothetical protein B0H14DRAFT_3147682 [Mycena olivaceomarginata]